MATKPSPVTPGLTSTSRRASPSTTVTTVRPPPSVRTAAIGTVSTGPSVVRRSTLTRTFAPIHGSGSGSFGTTTRLAASGVPAASCSSAPPEGAAWAVENVASNASPLSSLAILAATPSDASSASWRSGWPTTTTGLPAATTSEASAAERPRAAVDDTTRAGIVGRKAASAIGSASWAAYPASV